MCFVSFFLPFLHGLCVWFGPHTLSGITGHTTTAVVHIEEVEEKGIAHVIEKARRVIGDSPCYVSFDVDGLDPAFAPGTGTPEVGGLTPREVQGILQGLAGAVNVVGGDVMEVAPMYDPSTNTALVAAQMLFEILSLMALSPGGGRRAA